MLLTEHPPIMHDDLARTEQLDIIAGSLPHHWHCEWFFRQPKMSTGICVIHDDLAWKNRTTH